MVAPLITAPGGPELILIVLVIMLLFGAKKLPELARGSGRALRIFKAETRGLMDDDDDDQRRDDVRRDDHRDTQPDAQRELPRVDGDGRDGIVDAEVDSRPEYRSER